MGLFKADVLRFFAFGFAAGALFVLGSLGVDLIGGVANGVAPPASAAAPDR